MAEPLVLLPGLMCDARLFGPQIAALSSEHSITIGCLTSDETIEAMAERVLADAPGRFALAGLSMGGIVAMEIVRRAPKRVNRLALMDTNPLAETPQIAASREPQIVAVRTGKLERVLVVERKPNYLAPGPNREEVLALVMDMARHLGPDVFVRQSRALQKRRDQQKPLRTLKMPTMILCGEHDALCPVRRHTFMAELIHGAELVVLANSGH